MVEVCGHLVGGRTVFLAGETVECEIIFRASSSPRKKAKFPVKLAWASAQIHCQCSVNESKVILDDKVQTSPEQPSKAANSETSFVPFRGEKGATVFSSKPSILFCDVLLNPGDSHTYHYKETLPLDIPPSYRGNCLKYSYKVTVGTQKVGCPIKLLRTPFRVLVVPGLENMINANEEEGEECRPTNPFYQPAPKKCSILDHAMEALQLLTCRKNPGFFSITNKLGRVAEFCLFKQAFRLGDDVVGVCNFENAEVKCVQFSVTLQCEEQLLEGCRSRSSNIKIKDVVDPVVTSFNKHEEFCLFTDRTHVTIPIPLTSTPAFITDLVSVRWRLHFEFVTLTTPMKERSTSSNQEEESWTAPSHLDVEAMIWDLPIKVYATNPAFINKVSMLNHEEDRRTENTESFRDI